MASGLKKRRNTRVSVCGPFPCCTRGERLSSCPAAPRAFSKGETRQREGRLPAGPEPMMSSSSGQRDAGSQTGKRRARHVTGRTSTERLGTFRDLRPLQLTSMKGAL
ncbi:hypothetical protein COCON_G00148530 [Conger conger]|uniref:Uncharacterized protein n=1 Tax=Conger conger TaxID=82655 RepID=A0A9Q1DD26_CONCO|nr:hypothetical protein COCON_G00148530 [Conger conger]